MTEAGAEPDAEARWIEPGRKLFAGPCDFFFAAAEIRRPAADRARRKSPSPGRSNVGKSSLDQCADRPQRASRAPRTRPAARRN